MRIRSLLALALFIPGLAFAQLGRYNDAPRYNPGNVRITGGTIAGITLTTPNIGAATGTSVVLTGKLNGTGLELPSTANGLPGNGTALRAYYDTSGDKAVIDARNVAVAFKPLEINASDVTLGQAAGTASGSLVTVGATQTLTNKTLTAPTITGDVTATGAALLRNITTQTGATYSVSATDTHVIANRAGTVTLTLGTATLGREITVRTITANTVVSASSNVVPCVGGSAGTAILAATAGKWAMMVGDGSSWQIQACN